MINHTFLSFILLVVFLCISFGSGEWLTIPLVNVGDGHAYTVTIAIDDQPFVLHFDTGSDDIWVPHKDAECYDPYTVGHEYSPRRIDCNFDNVYSGDPTIPDHLTVPNADIAFGGNKNAEFVKGPFGRGTVKIHGYESPDTPIELPDTPIVFAKWIAIDSSTKLAHTSGFFGAGRYSTIIQDLADSYNIEEQYELVLPKGSDGHLRIGSWSYDAIEMPMVAYGESLAVTLTGVRIVSFKSAELIVEDRVAVIDSGTTLFYLHREIADSIADVHSDWWYDDDLERYRLPYGCNERFVGTRKSGLKALSLVFGAAVIDINLYNFYLHKEDGTCVLQLSRSPPDSDTIYLGTPFLWNVAVFVDTTEQKIAFEQR